MAYQIQNLAFFPHFLLSFFDPIFPSNGCSPLNLFLLNSYTFSTHTPWHSSPHVQTTLKCTISPPPQYTPLAFLDYEGPVHLTTFHPILCSSGNSFPQPGFSTNELHSMTRFAAYIQGLVQLLYMVSVSLL